MVLKEGAVEESDMYKVFCPQCDNGDVHNYQEQFYKYYDSEEGKKVGSTRVRFSCKKCGYIGSALIPWRKK